jgi:hypothetical protein
MHELLRKFRDIALSVLLIVIFVLIINVTVIHIEWKYIWEFLLGALLVYIGLSVFLLGVDIGISPIGHHMGKVMTRSNKKWIVATGSLILGFIVSLAEPSLMILGQQVETVTSGKIDNYLLIVVVSIGIGTLVSIAAMRIITGFSIKTLFFILYGIILILSFFVSNEFLAITFDASGATTGSLTVPFLLALTVGIAVIKTKQGSAEEDSFGLLGIASAGAIISTLVLGLFINTHNLDGGGVITHEDVSFFPVLLTQLKNVAIAMIPIVVVFIAAQFFKIKFNRKANLLIAKGLIYAFIGLTIFMTGVNGGFMAIGREVGTNLNLSVPDFAVFVIGFILGMLVILAEPAVYVLTRQIEDVTSGSIKRFIVLIALSLGNGIAIGLSMVRITNPGVEIWHFLLPGYIITLTLCIFTPKIFVGIAFDSGGVASGPLTATFMLAFCQGIATGTGETSTLIDGFGMITMVALMPLITLQILGLIYKAKTKKHKPQEE